MRVLELSQYIPGPYATLQMVKMGAEVIKIEPLGGDPMRVFGWSGNGISPVYLHLNRGKNVTEVDLKSISGKAKLKELIESANVLVEGFRPGTLERLGFSYRDLTKINPQIIVCHISGFGQTGERAQRAGHDLGYGAYAGYYALANARQKPHIIFPPLADHAGALTAVAEISAALYQQVITGKGCELDISLCQSIADWQYISEVESIRQLTSGAAAFYTFYLTQDQRYVSLAAIEAKFWRAFCEAVSEAAWIPRQAEPLPQKDLINDIAALFASQSLAHWQALLEKVDCCFEPVVQFDELHQRNSTKTWAADIQIGSFRKLQLQDADKIDWENQQ